MTGDISLTCDIAPWNTCWSGEYERFEVRQCRWAGRRALWQPHAPGEGRPLFKLPHAVRQRRSIAQMLCTVCGLPTPADDRWTFFLSGGTAIIEGQPWFYTTEAPTHYRCAALAHARCPFLEELGREPMPAPARSTVLASLIGGPEVEKDFGLKITEEQGVVGQLKLCWPLRSVPSEFHP